MCYDCNMNDKNYSNKPKHYYRAENNKLRIQWEKVQVLFESARQGVLITEIKTKKLLYVNSTICEMFGHRVEEFEGMGVDDIHPKEYIKYVNSEYESQVAGEKILAKNIPCQRKNGSIFYANIHSIPTLVDDINCALAIFIDITEQRNIAEELQKYRISLELLVQKRTTELTNEIQERKRIAKSLEEKNIALREILRQLDIEKKVMQKNILNNVTMLTLPVINDLRQMGNGIDGKHLDLLEGHLKHLTSAFGTKITDVQFKLTIREMRICDLVKGGLTTKEIGSLLKISPKTVESFRTSIRKKLNIKNKNINLPTYLQHL